MLLGTIMMLNVWGVIWRNQKVVLANAANVCSPAARPTRAPPRRVARRCMASRQNTIFSVSMVWFMVFKGHSLRAGDQVSSGSMMTFWILTLIIIAVLEVNALGLLPWKTQPNKGLNVIYDGPGVRNALIASFGLWAVFMILAELFLQA